MEVDAQLYGVIERPELPLQRKRGQRLHLVNGSPWKDALSAYIAGGGFTDGDHWEAPDNYDKGDLLLTILDSRPKMVLCLEVARVASRSKDTDIRVREETTVFSPMIPLDVLTAVAHLGRPLPGAPATLSDDLADQLLKALQAEVTAPTSFWHSEGKRGVSVTRRRSSGLQALVLAQSRGVCSACYRDYGTLLDGRGFVALEVHHRTPLSASAGEIVHTATDDVTVLCAGCHKLMHAKPAPSLEELQAAWAGPSPGTSGGGYSDERYLHCTRHLDGSINDLRDMGFNRSDIQELVDNSLDNYDIDNAGDDCGEDEDDE